MQPSISSAVARALPIQAVEDGAAHAGAGVDLGELEDELEQVAIEALDARMRGLDLDEAVRDQRFPHLVAFHDALRDALLVEIPRELQPWIAAIGGQPIQQRLPRVPATSSPTPELMSERLATLHGELFAHAFGADPASAGDGPEQLKAALSELLLFEAVRLQLLVMVWSSTSSASTSAQAIVSIA